MQPPLEALAEESEQRTHHVEKSCAALEGVPQTAHQVYLLTAGKCLRLESWGSMHPHDAVDAPSKQPALVLAPASPNKPGREGKGKGKGKAPPGTLENRDISRDLEQIPDNIDGGLGRSGQSVEPAPPRKKQKRADKAGGGGGGGGGGGRDGFDEDDIRRATRASLQDGVGSSGGSGSSGSGSSGSSGMVHNALCSSEIKYVAGAIVSSTSLCGCFKHKQAPLLVSLHSLPTGNNDGIPIARSLKFAEKSTECAREGDDLVGFLHASQSAEVIEGGDLEDTEPLNWVPAIFSTPSTSTSAATSYVADLPRRPGHVAVRSASVKGKGDLVMVVQESHYGEAVQLFLGRPNFDWPDAADNVEGDPHLGVLPGENGAPSFQFASRSDAITAILQTKQPYGDVMHKFLALAILLRWETPEVQQTMDAAVPDVRLPENAQYFVDAQGNALRTTSVLSVEVLAATASVFRRESSAEPKIAVRKVHDTGGGANVDYSDGGWQSDPTAFFAFGGGTIGGAQNGASRIVAFGSAEDSRLNTDAVAASTSTDSTLVVRLYDAVVLAARGKPPYKMGPWLSDNVVGIAKVAGRRGVSLVETMKGKTRGGEPWVWLVTLIDNWEWCWPGPFFVVTVTGQACFSGYKNLGCHDKEGACQMEVGRSGDFSTPAAKGKIGGLQTGGAGNPHGSSKNTGLGEADRQAACVAGYTDERETFGICLGVSTSGFKKRLKDLVEPSGRIVVETLCKTPEFDVPGRTLEKTSWAKNSTGQLVLGYHNGNASTAHPRCQRGGTLPGVLKPGGDGVLCWHVPDWAVDMVRAGNVVFLSSHNKAARAAAKAARPLG